MSNEEFYRKIGRVYCPYFKDHIYFTRSGLEHLKFKNKFKIRNKRDREVRFRLLPKSKITLEISATIQGISTRKRFEYKYVNNRQECLLLEVTYYEFIAIIDNLKLKTIIKQIENDRKIFLSVIPLFKLKTPPFEDDGFNEHLVTAECRDG